MIADGNPVDPFEREHAPCAALSNRRCRHAEAFVVRRRCRPSRKWLRLPSASPFRWRRTWPACRRRQWAGAAVRAHGTARSCARRRSTNRESFLKRCSMPGRKTFNGHVLLTCRRRLSTLALCTWAMEAAATGGPNSANSVVDRRFEFVPRRRRTASVLRERRQAVLQTWTDRARAPGRQYRPASPGTARA